VPTVRSKKRLRILVSIVFFSAVLAAFLLGWYVYYQMTGHLGFGLDKNK